MRRYVTGFWFSTLFAIGAWSIALMALLSLLVGNPTLPILYGIVLIIGYGIVGCIAWKAR